MSDGSAQCSILQRLLISLYAMSHYVYKRNSL